MNKKEYLRIVRQQIHYISDRDAIEEELAQHIQDSILDLMDDGIPFEEAEVIAISQMGDPLELGKQLNKEHHPLIGYLWNISQYVLFLLIFPAFIIGGNLIYDTIKLATPTVVDDSIEVIPLNLEVDIPTHDVKIDNICLSEDGTYYITYRSWTDFRYSRAGWSSSLFHIENSEGKHSENGGYQSSGILGTHGYKSFTWPEDGLLNIISVDGNRLEIDLKEYFHEKK